MTIIIKSKRMKKIIFVVIAIIFFGQGYAQISKFNLSDYKLPDMKRHFLETNFDLSGNNNYYKQPIYSQNVYDEQNANEYSGRISINYSSYLNKATVQRQAYGGINLGSYFSNTKLNDTLKNENYNIYPRLNYTIINRRYFKNAKFIETDFYGYYSFQKSHGYSRNPSIGALYADSKTHEINAYLPIKMGTGRIEEVQDARQAVYLLDELAKQNRVKVNLKNEDVLAFAKLISELKNKRFFDTRIREIYEIEAIDSFLQANNYVLKSDARYFTTLRDFWDYGNTPIRKSGTRVSVGIIPGFYIYDNIREGNIDFYYYQNINAYFVNAGIEVIREKPINLYWQNTLGINGFAGTIKGKFESNSTADYNASIPNIQLGFNHRIGYYPSTRTAMTFSYALNYMQLFGKSDKFNMNLEMEGPQMKASTNLSIYYYISPKLRLSVISSLYYIWSDTKNSPAINLDNLGANNFLIDQLTDFSPGFGNYILENKFYHNFSIRLTYSIF